MISDATIKAAIRDVAGSGKRRVLSDAGPRGAGRLRLLLEPREGRVSTDWFATSRRGGKTKSAKIGIYPLMTLADARKAFASDHAGVIAAGGAPVKDALYGRTGATVGALFNDYVAHLIVSERPSAMVAKHHLDALAAHIGRDKVAAAVTTGDIASYLGLVHGRGSAVCARACRSYAHAAFARALKAEHDYTRKGDVKSWGLVSNPVAAIPVDASAARAGQRHLSAAEWVTLWRWLERQDNATMAARAIRVCMMVGQRLKEVTSLSGPQFDPDEMMLDWSVTKNKMPHAIPVPRRAGVILSGLCQVGSGLLFPQAGDSTTPMGYDAMLHLIGRFLAAHPDIEHFTPRDLRRTWKTLAGAAGLSKEIRDRLQNHAQGDVSAKHYDRYAYLVEKREAMAKWEAYVERLLTADPQ